MVFVASILSLFLLQNLLLLSLGQSHTVDSRDFENLVLLAQFVHGFSCEISHLRAKSHFSTSFILVTVRSALRDHLVFNADFLHFLSLLLALKPLRLVKRVVEGVVIFGLNRSFYCLIDLHLIPIINNSKCKITNQTKDREQ